MSLYNICIAIFSCTVIPIIQIYAKFDWKFSSVLHKLISFCMFQNSYPSSHEQHIWCQMRLKLCFQRKPNIYRSSTWAGFILCSIDNKEPVFSLAFSKNSFFTESQGSLFKRIKFKLFDSKNDLIILPHMVYQFFSKMKITFNLCEISVPFMR